MTAAMTSSPWADLPPDLLGDVAGRLRDAVDLIHIHAICTPWRDSLLSLTRPRPCPLTFPPWPLLPCKGMVLHSVVDLRRETASCCNNDVILAEPPGVSFADDKAMTWVASTDGTGVWLFTNTRLLNVFTGAVTRLPRFREHDDRRYMRRMENLRGVLYGDGTVFLYSVVSQCHRSPVFTAAILRPGEAAWTFVKTRIERPLTGDDLHPGATYHDGQILVCLCAYHQFLITLNDDGNDHRLRSWWTPLTEPTYYRDSDYVLESRGELLLVSVLFKLDRHGDAANDDPELAGANLFLMVQALEEEEVGSSHKMRWVPRDGLDLEDRVLFLGSPTSFAVDAVQLGMDGGCAYFVFRLGLFKYNLVDGEANLVKRLSPVYGTATACMWLQPQLSIAPIHEIRNRIERPDKMKKQKVGLCQMPKQDLRALAFVRAGKVFKCSMSSFILPDVIC